MFIGTYGIFAHPMSMITTVGKYLAYWEMETGGKMFVGHLRAFSPRIMLMMMISSIQQDNQTGQQPAGHKK